MYIKFLVYSLLTAFTILASLGSASAETVCYTCHDRSLFTGRIVHKPMSANKCGACHNASNNLKDLDLTSYAGITEGGESGVAIISGDPENSLIVIIQTSEEPHFAQLTSDELGILEQWIADGALEE